MRIFNRPLWRFLQHASLGAAALLAACTQDAKEPGAIELSARIAQLERKLEHQADIQKINDVFSRFGRGFDRQDAEMIKSAFWPDAQLNYGMMRPLLGPDLFIAKNLPGFSEIGSYGHHVTVQTVDIVGDTAHVEAYVIFLDRSKDDRSTSVIGGRYVDRLDRRNGEWRIAVHEFIPHFAMKGSSVFESYYTREMYPRSSCALGTRDKRDPSYRRPLMQRPDQDAELACAE